MSELRWIEKQLRHHFHRVPTGMRSGIQLHDALWDWSFLGYSGFWSVRFYLFEGALRLYETRRTLNFPPYCCVCEQPASAPLSFYPIRSVGPLVFRANEPSATGIPHCGAHEAPGSSGLAVARFNERTRYAHVVLLGLSRRFLCETLALNTEGDEVSPPWIVFTASQPWIGWNQGINEHWMRLAFRPFWARLGANERQEYLERWNAPNAWRLALRNDV